MTAPNRLKPVDYIEDIIIAHDVNYFYQRYDSAGGQLRRVSKSNVDTGELLTAWSDIGGAGYAPDNMLILSTGTMVLMGTAGSGSGSDLIIDGVTITGAAVLYLSPTGRLTTAPNGDAVGNVK